MGFFYDCRFKFKIILVLGSVRYTFVFFDLMMDMFYDRIIFVNIISVFEDDF